MRKVYWLGILAAAACGCLYCVSSPKGGGVSGALTPPAGSPPAVVREDTTSQTGLLNTVTKLEAAVNRLDTTIQADVKIGGGSGDSVTSWIQAVAPWLTWLLYPLVWRPARRKWGNGIVPAAGINPPAPVDRRPEPPPGPPPAPENIWAAAGTPPPSSAYCPRPPSPPANETTTKGPLIPSDGAR